MSAPAATRSPRPVAHAPRAGRRVVVVEATGYRLRAAVVVATAGRPRVDRLVESRLGDPAHALGEAVATLKQDGRVPRSAVLLSAQVVPALFELPVSLARPRPAAQMNELVRWELEPHLAQQAGSRPIGAILVGRGHLTPEQVAEVTGELGRRRGSRFGEVAVDLGFVEPAQVDEALRIQRWFSALDEDVICGWAGQGISTGDDERSAWLACALGRRARAAWIEAFAAAGLRLEAIYPALTVGTAAFNGSLDGGGRASLVDVRGDVFGCARVSREGVEAVSLLSRAEGTAPLDRCLELLDGREHDPIWLSGCDADGELASLRDQLAAVLGRAPSFVPVSTNGLPEKVAPSSLASIAAAGAHALRLAPPDAAVCIPARDPRPDLARRPGTWWAAAVAVLALAAVGGEKWRTSRLATARQEHARAERELGEKDRLIARVKRTADQAAALGADLAADQARIRALRVRADLLGETLPRRARQVPALLATLAELAPAGMAIDRIHEDELGRLHLAAFAVSQTDAEAFAAALQSRLEPWRLTLEHQAITRRKGRLDISGFALELRFVAAVPGATTAPDTAPAREGE